MDEVKIIEVIYCTKMRRGKGSTHDPIRIVREIFEPNGLKIMEEDSEVRYTQQDMMDFSQFCFDKDCAITKDELFKEWLSIYTHP